MKNLIQYSIILLLSIVFIPSSFGQITTKSQKSKYRVWVVEEGRSLLHTEVKINNLGDTSFTAIIVGGDIPFITKNPFINTGMISLDGGINSDEIGNLKTYDIKNVKSIKVRKKGRVFRGVLIGAAIGFTTGMVMGTDKTSEFSSGPNYIPDFFNSKEAKGLALGALGATVGYVVSNFKITIPINGKKINYKRNRKRLKSFLPSKN